MSHDKRPEVQIKLNDDSRANKYLAPDQVRRLEAEMSESFSRIVRTSTGAELIAAFESFIDMAVASENFITSNAVLVDETYKPNSVSGAASLSMFSSVAAKSNNLPVPTGPGGVGILPLSKAIRAARMASMLGALVSDMKPLKDEDLMQATLNLMVSRADAEIVGAVVFSHRMDGNEEPERFRGKNIEEDEEYQEWVEPISSLVVEAVAFEKDGEEHRVTKEYKLNREEGVWVQLPPEQVNPQPHWTLQSVQNPFTVDGGATRMLAGMLGVDPDEFAGGKDEDEDDNGHQSHVDGLPPKWGGSKGSIKA